MDMIVPEQNVLQRTQDDFLAGCNHAWGKRELRAVQRKLERIGVEAVPDLLRETLSGLSDGACLHVSKRRYSSANNHVIYLRSQGKSIFNICSSVLLVVLGGPIL